MGICHRRSELRRHATQYAAAPEPVTKQTVDFHRPPILQPPAVDDVVQQAPPPAGDLFGSAHHYEQREVQRRLTESAWGVWIWLVAELVPDGEQPSLGY